MQKKTKNISCGTLVHDGRTWRLYHPFKPEVVAVCTGQADELSEEMLSAAEGFASLLVLMAGEVHRMEGALPKRIHYPQAQARVAENAAEISGREAAELTVAPGVLPWKGCRAKFTLSAVFDRARLENLHDQFVEIDVASMGFGSLQLAIQAAWSAHEEARRNTLVVIDEAFAYVLPAQRNGNPGPRSAPGGVRHFAADPENWTTRLGRLLKEVGPSPVLTLLVVTGDSPAKFIPVLNRAGYADVRPAEADAFLREACGYALKANAETLTAVVPIVNPYALRKKFSHAWIVLPALAILAIPFLADWIIAAQCRAREEANAKAAQEFRPLQQKIKAAETRRDSAERQLRMRRQFLQTLVARRRPLDDFINVAYYFCKHAGPSVRLESIEEVGGELTVKGRCGDPEDGVKMNDGLKRFLEAHDLSLVSYEVTELPEPEGHGASHFEIRVADGTGGGNAR